MAGSTHTLTSHSYPRRSGSPIGEVVTATLGDASNGTVPTLTFQLPVDSELISLETNPGSTGPSVDWDVTLLDIDGFDVLQGLGIDRHTSTTLRQMIYVATMLSHPIVLGGEDLVLTIGGTTVNEGTAVIKLLYRRLY
jgi:hypothetical protein